MLDVCLLGTSGMMPLPGRWLTALMARCNGSSILIDCGEGTQIAIKQKGWSVHDIDIICFTHYHGDHISGLPGLLLSMGNAERERPVRLVGPKGLERVVNALRVIAPELPFELDFLEIGTDEISIDCGSYLIEAFKVNHNVTCYGYSIVINRAGKFMPEKAEMNNVPKMLWSKLQKGAVIEYEGRTFTSDLILGEKRKGIKVTYCTDTRPVPSIIKAAKNADLFVCEGMYGEPGKEKKAVEHKHMTFAEAAELGKKAEVKEMWLTHYSPSLIRPDDYIKPVLKIFENVKAGKDAMSKTIVFEDEQ